MTGSTSKSFNCMPPKRTHAEMSATGMKPPALDSCPQGEQLVAFARREHEVIQIYLGSYDAPLGSIFLPREKLESVYRRGGRPFVYRQHGSGSAPRLLLSESNCPEVLGLFVQWLYNGRYTELNGPVKNFDRSTTTPLLDMCEAYEKDTMEWTVKAAILAWSLGRQLDVPAFQNHAIRRLFAAFSRPSKRPLLTPALYECVKRLDHRFPFMGLASWTDWNNKGPLARAIDVTIIRNWGDAAVVDQEELKSWDSLLKSNDTFREKFLEGSLLSLEQRREKVLVVEDYF